MVRQADGGAVHEVSEGRHGDVLQQDNATLDVRSVPFQLLSHAALRSQRWPIPYARLLVRCLILALCLGYYAGYNTQALAHFKDRPDLDSWFAKLASKKGLCCSFADGVAISDVDWDTQDSHYRVRLDGKWINVPDDAVITEGNRYGPAVVWPQYYWALGATKGEVSGIRCFMPGGGT